MANPTIRARLILDTSGYTKGTQEAKKATGTFGQIRNTMVGVFGGNLMTAAASKAKDFFTGAITGAVDAEQATARFNTTLGNLGFAKQTGQAASFIASLSKQTAIAKGPLRSSFETMIRSTHNFGQAQAATTLATNIAAGTGKDLGAVSLALGKAFNGNVTGLQRLGIKTTAIVPNMKAVQTAQTGVLHAQVAYDSALKKFGPNSDQARAAGLRLTEAQGKLAAAHKETKKQALPVDQVIKNLSKTFNNQAATAANTTAGRMKNAQLQFKAFQVTIGQVLLPALTALLGIFEQFMPVLQGFANWAKSNPTALKIMVGVILALVAAYKAWGIYQAIVSAATTEGTVANWLFNASLWANPITWIVIGIIALVAILVVLQMKFGILTTVMNAVWAVFKVVWNAIVAGAQWVFSFFISHWPLLISILLGPIGIITALIIKNWDTIKKAVAVLVNAIVVAFNWVKGPVLGVVNFLKTIWNGFIAFIRGVIGVVAGVASAIGHAFDVVRGIISSVIGGARSIIDGFIGAIRGAIGTVSGIAHGIANALKAPINGVIGLINGIHFTIGPWTLPKVHIPPFGPDVGGNTIGPWTLGFPHIPQLQSGGLVTRAGLALLHPAEVVVPAPAAQAGLGGPLVVVENAYFGDQVDIDTFMDRVAWHAARSTA